MPETGSLLGSQIQKVAVCESPTREQVQMIEHMGYDILQVHGELGRDVLSATSLPVFRAYNVGGSDEVQPERSDKIIAYVLDGAVAGSGEKFEWNDMKSFDRDGKNWCSQADLPQTMSERDQSDGSGHCGCQFLRRTKKRRRKRRR